MKYLVLIAFIGCVCACTYSQDLIKVGGSTYPVKIIGREGKTITFYELDDPDQKRRTIKMSNIETVYFKEYGQGHFSVNFKFNFTAYGTNHIIRKYLDERKGRMPVPGTGNNDYWFYDLFGDIRIPFRFGLDLDYCINEYVGFGGLLEYYHSKYVEEQISLAVNTWSFKPHIQLSDYWHVFHLLVGPAFSSHTFKDPGDLRSNDHAIGIFTGIEVDISNKRKSFTRLHLHCRFNEKVTIGPFDENLTQGKYRNLNVVIGLSIGSRFLGG